MATVGRRISFETLANRTLGLVQRGAARKLDVLPAAEEVRRGETLDVRIRADGKHEDLEAGIMCTETFPAFVVRAELTRSRDEFEDEVVYEQWQPVGPLQETARLSVPADAPYTYAGENLKFKWRVAVRQKRRGVDAVRTREIRVLP